MTLTEAGLLTKWLRDYSPVDKCDRGQSESLVMSLGITPLQGPFVILAGGTLLGLLAFVAEIVIYRLGQRMRIQPARIIHVQGVNGNSNGYHTNGPTECWK